jgi:adenylate kinase
VVLLRASNTILFDRLKERGYSQKKITENIECEILEVTKEEVERYSEAVLIYNSSYKPEIILELVNELPN